ncbi:hypothetical protein CRI77_03050 [Mycolicibacterium duvalii]|uniref:Uncharacterized protein n=1 Tax=Mycolicibacterium duvalii TaxID=39688 RepID=A0A7I7JXT1_9MYCO|nr:hypothetical protein [Mycolicibacterium duvalii]MCV7366831.1 hypothetical protein [Mycolicibacterium duvalii]PEG43958.1 hypothetical protein CRI77_03050 [Mycolicibacterium duvalii]BBX16706.1 hypothetical protein MDUV_15660 [Mycolicibacterium duvalii]
MTTAEHARDLGARRAATVSIAGVPWPLYKVVALIVGLATFIVVGAIAASAAPAVLIGAGAATLAWIGGSLIGSVGYGS